MTAAESLRGYSGRPTGDRKFNNCRKIASLTIATVSKYFSSPVQHALKDERHFAIANGWFCNRMTLGRDNESAVYLSDSSIAS
jgi:hypothetical protein